MTLATVLTSQAARRARHSALFLYIFQNNIQVVSAVGRHLIYTRRCAVHDNRMDVKHEVIAVLGFPDEIASERLIMSQIWRCDWCDRHYHFGRPAPIPAPCAECGGIAFTALDEDNDA